MYTFPPVSLLGKVLSKLADHLYESDPDSSGLAQNAMVLGSGGTVVPDPSLPTPSS